MKVDDGLEWKDGDTMHWWVLLTENCTQCTFEGARRDRARINAFYPKPLASQKDNITAFMELYYYDIFVDIG